MELVIRVFKEVAGIHQYSQPGRIETLDDAQQTFRRARKPPVVFQGQRYPALGGFWQAFRYAFDTPLKAVLFRVAGQNGFLAASP